MNIILVQKPHLFKQQFVLVRTFAAQAGVRIHPGPVRSNGAPATVGKDCDAHVVHVGDVKGAVTEAIKSLFAEKKFSHLLISFDFNSTGGWSNTNSFLEWQPINL